MFYDSFQLISFKRTFVKRGSCQNAETQTQSYLLHLINNIFVMPFRHMLLDVPTNSQMIAPISYNIQHSPGVALLQNPFIRVFSKIKQAFFSRNCLKLETPFRNNCKSNYLKLNFKLSTEQSCLKYLDEKDKIQTVMSLKSILPNTSLQASPTEKDNTHHEDVILKVKSPLTNPATQNLFAWFIGFTTTTPFASKMCTEASDNSKNQGSVAILKQNSGKVESYVESNLQTKTLCSHPIYLGVSRQRTSSEHSDDICFLEDKSATLPNYDDENSDDDYSSGDSDQENCIFEYDDNHYVSEDDDEEYNAMYEIQNESLNSASVNNFQTNENTSKKKIVRFNLTPEVHTMYAWNFAYRSARKGHWESYARDRDRFRKRIQRASIYLNPILSCEHRSFIYKNRFANKM